MSLPAFFGHQIFGKYIFFCLLCQHLSHMVPSFGGMAVSPTDVLPCGASEGPLFTGLVSVSVASARRSRLLPRSWAPAVKPMLKHIKTRKHSTKLVRKLKYTMDLITSYFHSFIKIQLLRVDFDEPTSWTEIFWLPNAPMIGTFNKHAGPHKRLVEPKEEKTN